MTAFILDNLWQSTLVAALLGLLTLGFQRNRADVRYGLWLAASVKFLIPFSAIMALAAAFFRPLRAEPPQLHVLQPVLAPFSTTDTVMVPAPATLDWPALALAVWLLGVVCLFAIWLIRWSRLRSAMRGAVTLPLSFPVAVLVSPTMLEPGIVGLWNPVLLLPRGITENLSKSEFNAIIAHELHHLRRRDNVTATLHMLVETLFWFHPLVWWIGARLIAERENACDEAVLKGGNAPEAYAEAILKVCKLFLRAPLACTPGVSGADLKKRVEAIMAQRFSAPLNVTKKLALVTIAASVIAVPFALGLLAAPTDFAQSEVGGASPGTEVALRAQIEGWENRQPAIGDMTQPLAEATRQQQAAIQLIINGLGPLKSLEFKGRYINADTYLATFQNGALTWSIAPLVGGKIAGLRFTTAIIRSGDRPGPGTQEALRQVIAGYANGKPPYEIMLPAADDATVQQLGSLLATAKALGPLKTLSFKNVNPLGWDVYDAVYENGRAVWSLAPLTDGKVGDIVLTDTVLNNAQPHPDREASLRRYIESLERGIPNYDDMTPPLAGAVRQQLSSTLGTIKELGALQSISFEHGGAPDSDIYLVTFEHGKVEWLVGALTADSKAQVRRFRVL